MPDAVEMNTRNLDKLIKALREPLPTVRVGILGDKNARKESVDNNATIGAKHEFGEDGMSQRSFLRVPIIENLQKYLDKSDAFNPAALGRIAKEGTIIGWLENIGKIAALIVDDAFETGGFGKWKPSNMKFKKRQQTLVETQQLRNSISSEVK